MADRCTATILGPGEDATLFLRRCEMMVHPVTTAHRVTVTATNPEAQLRWFGRYEGGN